MTSGPCLLQVLEGENAINLNRDLMGATNPQEASEGLFEEILQKALTLMPFMVRIRLLLLKER